ncbi:MAG TPA: DUF4352 domain-containing protein [Polyangiaceae bacterium]|nr:DUF4352 domain-containing protein [Polyangiaceae bacterium]
MAPRNAWIAACTLMAAALVACERAEHPAPSGSVAELGAGIASERAPNSAPSGGKLDMTPPKPDPRTFGPSPASHAVGERAESRDYFMTLVRVTTCDVEPHFRPARGRIKLGLEVLIEARSLREVPANPFLATLRDAQERDYQADLAGCTPTLRADRLAQNQKAQGFITFEVPEDATGLVMTYAPFIVGVGSEELTFALGR